MVDDGSYGTGRSMYIATDSEYGPNSSLINVQLEKFPNRERAPPVPAGTFRRAHEFRMSSR